MIRIAQERVFDLFALAESESLRGPSPLPDRYVRLARRIGTRYNVRLPAELAERYCRGCSAYWTEGRTVRTRLRGSRRVQTCLVCGRIRRTRWGDPRLDKGGPPPGSVVPGPMEASAPVDAGEEEPDDAEGDDEEG